MTIVIQRSWLRKKISWNLADGIMMTVDIALLAVEGLTTHTSLPSVRVTLEMIAIPIPTLPACIEIPNLPGGDLDQVVSSVDPARQV